MMFPKSGASDSGGLVAFERCASRDRGGAIECRNGAFDQGLKRRLLNKKERFGVPGVYGLPSKGEFKPHSRQARQDKS
jgi:hypothetical protein